MDVSVEIREAATRRFARDGFDSTSLQTIADEVGITKPTLLYHYPSKEVLRRAVFEHLVEHWRLTLPRLLEAVTSGHQRFDALTGELVAFFKADPDRARLLVRALLDHPEEMRRRLMENMRPWVMLVAQYVKQGQESGILYEETDPEVYVMHVITLVTATMANLAVLPLALGTSADDKKVSEERYLAELFRLARTALFKPRKKTSKTSGASTPDLGDGK